MINLLLVTKMGWKTDGMLTILLSTTPKFWKGMQDVEISCIQDIIEFYPIQKFRSKISFDKEMTGKI